MDDYPVFKISDEDMERLRTAAAQLSAAASQAYEAIIEAVTEFYRRIGMTAQEVDEAINGAVQAAQEAEKLQRTRRTTYKPPRRPLKAPPAACKSIQAYNIKRPVARSHVQRRGDRKRG